MKRKLILFVCALASIGIVCAQTISVKGVVLSEDDLEPIIGASVLVKGKNTGTITDIDGGFSLKVNDPAAILVISYLGMLTQEVAIGSNLTIKLKPNTQKLDEIVVVAYGQQRKEAITGAVSSIRAAEFDRRPITSATAALEGQALGVQVNNAYGEPGATSSIRVRGFNTINGNNSPHFVIDGVPMGGSINDIDPADIESITVLKDASSAALYGNKAANGVILITTKSGRSGKENLQMQVSINHGFYQRGIKEYKRLDAYQFMEVYWLSKRNALYTNGLDKNVYKDYSDANADALNDVIEGIGKEYNIFNKSWDELFDANGKLTAGTQIKEGYKNDLNWFEELERNGHRGQYNISAHGGSKKVTYFLSLGYLNENGFMKHSSGERTTGSVKVNIIPKEWLKMGITLNASNQEYKRMPAESTNSSSFINPFYFSRFMAPIYPVHMHDPNTGEYVLDENGQRKYDIGESRKQSNARHVIWESELNKDKTYRNTLNTTIYTDIYFLKNFTFSIKANQSIRSSLHKSYDNAIVGDGAGKGRISQSEDHYKNYLVQELLNWKSEFNKKHHIDILLGHENFHYNIHYASMSKADEKFAGNMELSNFTTMSSTTGGQNGYRTEGYFGRASYNFNDIYFAEVSIRRDGSSRFYKSNRWGNFWSIGASWVVSKENFLKNAKWINYLKLRTAYGKVGQDTGVGFYGWMGLYSSTQNGGHGAYYKTQNEAKDISWEKAGSLSIGLESNLFNRLNFSLEYYDKTSEDLLFDVSLPSSIGSISTSGAGRPTITKNFGSVSNRGVELGMDIDIIRSKYWKWNMGTNLNFLKNKILKLPKEYDKDGYIRGVRKYAKGHDIYSFWLYQFKGIDLRNGYSLYLLDDQKYYISDKDYSGTGAKQENESRIELTKEYTIIDGEAYVYNTSYGKKDWSGSAIPKVYGSFTTSVVFKDFELSGLFTFQLGGKTMDYSYLSLMSVGANPSAIHQDILKAWTPEQKGNGIDPKGIPVINSARNAYNSSISNRSLISSDYFNIKNITLSYYIPRKTIRKIGLKDLILSTSIENLLTVTSMQGSNPQQTWNGVNNNAYVPARIITFGVNIKF